MAIANTVEVDITANFQDRFSGPSEKALNRFQARAEQMFRSLTAVPPVRTPVVLLDRATREARRIRTSLEQTFARPLVQEVRAAPRTPAPRGRIEAERRPAEGPALITEPQFSGAPGTFGDGVSVNVDLRQSIGIDSNQIKRAAAQIGAEIDRQKRRRRG